MQSASVLDRDGGTLGVAPESAELLHHQAPLMQFFRSTLLPAAIVLLFGLALFAVSARIWLPGDMAAPAPIN